MQKIPFFSLEATHLQCKDLLMKSIDKVVDAQWFILGNSLNSFEHKYAQWSSVEHCIGVNSGYDALVIALKTLGIGKGDEVILPANSFVATVMAVVQVGATPILVEPSMLTYNIDPYEVEKAITPKTKAILVVHLYGQACEMDALQFVAKLHDIPLVEDNAQAHGARFMGQLTGSFGQINATSFYPTKNLGALGDAGAITTSSEHLYLKAKTLRNYGSFQKYHYDEVGFNSRMDEIQASILETKLGLLDQWTLERVQIANNYSQQLKLVEQIVLPNTHPKSTHVYHLYTIRTHLRDQLKSFLHERGVETAIHYPIPPHLQPAYTFLGYGKGDLPITEEISDTTLSLPLYIGLRNQQIDEICQLIFEFFKKV